MMRTPPPARLANLLLACAALIIVLGVNRSLPWITTPALAGAIWTSGFAESFTHGAWYAVYARDFGIPTPAAIMFGLSGAWPTSVLLRFGMHAADAYTLMSAFWLAVGLGAAYRIARVFGVSRLPAWLAGIAWMSMPVVWAHGGYGMLSLGIGLLSFYFLAALRLFLLLPGSTHIGTRTALCYLLTVVIAIFMDGYSFTFFACGASFLLLTAIVRCKAVRHTLLWRATPIHVASFCIAYALYSLYVGQRGFDAYPLDYFRGWGLDLSFVVAPSMGVHWLPDVLGLSIARSDAQFFGDESVWNTTFSLPLIVAGMLAFAQVHKKVCLATALLLIAALSFYMALGPTLKIDATKAAPSMQIGEPVATMSAEQGLFETGNAWLSESLPGFKVMRAAYRWSALGVFSFWLLLVLGLAHSEKPQRYLWIGALLGLIAIDLPDIPSRLERSADNRAMFEQIDRELVTELRQRIRRKEIVAFLPWENDFLANYLAPKAGFRSLNIGGDKNLGVAQASWPPELLSLGGTLQAHDVPAALKVLVHGTASVLVVPYFHLRLSAFFWPCLALANIAPEDKQGLPSGALDDCPAQRKLDLMPFLDEARRQPWLQVDDDSPYFATIRLLPEYAGDAHRAALIRAFLGGMQYPLVMGDRTPQVVYLLRRGWHSPEAGHVWSTGQAELSLPVPHACQQHPCSARLTFAVFAASAQRPVQVLVRSKDAGDPWQSAVVATSSAQYHIDVPLRAASGQFDAAISIPDASSPLALGMAADQRTLGIALSRIELLGDTD